ncbi:hypothetical protein FF011L_23500 [Roseimaritima multifibrata]|uniref:Uncharacterized protein n=2 Tax=Roseimaritima multifibrata TaxID=1930274 RepID=A0A517MFN7_9BACT|nr:hypothetical protein FF011L_23500 [Roseimaritima multifibrata]
MCQPFVFIVALFICVAAFADDTFTSPQTIVSAEITPVPNRDGLIFTGAQLSFSTVHSPYHVESQRGRPDLANRIQDVTILESKIVRFGVNQLKFCSVAGTELEIEEVKTRLKENPLALLLPFGASIHPQLVAALDPKTIVVIRADRKANPQRLVPRPGNE